MADLLEAIKRAACGAIEDAQPVAIMYGQVISESPLKILIEQRLTLTESQLILTRNVTDFDLDVTADWTSAAAGDPTHTHALKGKRTLTVHNALKAGDVVLLLREHGGQRFVILDRMVK